MAWVAGLGGTVGSTASPPLTAPMGAGSACAVGASEPAECAPGTFTATNGQSRCDKCEAGMHQPAANGTACIECRAGTRCEPGASAELLCEAGTHQPARGHRLELA